MYPSVLSKKLPVGTFVKRTKENRFAPQTEGKTDTHQSLVWLLECEKKLGTPLQTRFSPSGEKKVFLKSGRVVRFDGLIHTIGKILICIFLLIFFSGKNFALPILAGLPRKEAKNMRLNIMFVVKYLRASILLYPIKYFFFQKKMNCSFVFMCQSWLL